MKQLNQYQRTKLNKILLIVASVMVVLATGIAILLFWAKEDKVEQPTYEDTIVCKHRFEEITIDLNSKTVKRDDKDTTLQEEFGIPNEQAYSIISSAEAIKNYFVNSTFEVSIEQGQVHLKNPYQTKTLLVEAEQIRDDFDAIEEPIQIQEGLFILKYDTEKRTKAAYEYIKSNLKITNIIQDEVSYIETLNDESQTVYSGNDANEKANANTLGATAMGLENYKKIVTDNGSASDVIIATIGYGAAIDNTYFNNRIDENYYNFTDHSKNIYETIPQGSRILEVIKESTTDNVKLLPLVVINDENYTTTADIIQALALATEKSDIICYEFVQKSNYMIKLALKKAFEKNVPVCCVTKSGEENEDIFPANDGTTIAVSSVDKNLKPTSYSATGDYLDFVASSTDVKEIFHASSSVSKWSGAEYSNAHIAGAIALIKSYNKNYSIREVYNFIRDYCQDLGENGKDTTYGYGFPNFSELKISDLDKEKPEIIELKVDDTEWDKTKKIQIKAKDNIKILGWNVTKTEAAPKELKRSDNVGNTLDTAEEVDDNGKYYIWVVDTAGNHITKTIEVTKVDKISPTIKYTIDESKKEDEKVITINVTGSDDQSGLHELPYSWDKLNWGVDNRSYKATANGTYKIYVRDKLGNIAEKEITIKGLPEKGTAEIDNGNIIKSISVSDKWEGNKNKEVTITFNNNLDIKRRKITDADVMPAEFRPKQSTETIERNTTSNETTTTNETVVTTVENNDIQGYTNLTVTVSLEANKKYYIWIEDTKGNVTSQGFLIKQAE